MQFLIYIHCHVVIILPLRCYSSYKRHSLYNQPAKIYLKSSLVICVLMCFARSRNAGNLLEEICSRYSLQKVQSQSSEGHSAPRWGTREAAKVLAKVISLCCVTVPVAIFCVRSKAVSSLPSLAKHLLISTLPQWEAVAPAPAVCWMLRCCLPGSGEDLRGFDTSFYLQYKEADLCFSVVFKYCILR